MHVQDYSMLIANMNLRCDATMYDNGNNKTIHVPVTASI